MVEAQQYRTTREAPLVGMETFCRNLERALSERYAPGDLPCIWRLYVSAECPRCGIVICGEELHALASAPCAEMASAKIGRMRLGNCARSGCNAWQYALYFWKSDGIDWPSLLEAADRPPPDPEISKKAPEAQWFAGLKNLVAHYALRTAVMAGVVLSLWLARQVYQGGRIPFFREPEQFTTENAAFDPTWPTPMDGSERSWDSPDSRSDI